MQCVVFAAQGWNQNFEWRKPKLRFLACVDHILLLQLKTDFLFDFGFVLFLFFLSVSNYNLIYFSNSGLSAMV